MLLTCYNINMKSGNPSGVVSILPGGGTNVQTAGSTSVPMVGTPTIETIQREFLDLGEPGTVTSGSTLGALGTPTAQLEFIALQQDLFATSSNTGAANWVIPQMYAQQLQRFSFGVVNKATDAADSPGGFATAYASGPCNANCVTTNGVAIAPGTLLTTDGNGNLTAFSLPSGAPTPTVTTAGTGGSTTYSYGLVAVSMNGTYSAIGTTASTTAGNATLSTTNYNVITWTPVGDAVEYIIVRTSAAGTPSTVGVIGIVPAQTAVFNDTGLAILPNTSATQFFQRTAAPSAPTVATAGTTGGTTTYVYKVSAILPNGVWSAESATGGTTTGNATLSSTNYLKITGTNVTGAVLYAIDRTSAAGTPSTTGIIGYTTSLTTGFSDIGLPSIATYAATVQTTPNVTPEPGTCYAMSLGTLAASTTAATSVAVFMGGL